MESWLMHSELLKYVVIVGSSGVLSLALSLYGAFKIRDSPRVKHYVILTFLSSVFAFGYMFEMMSTSIEEVKFWLSVEYLPLPFIPAFIVLMCFNYVGKKIYPAFYYLLFTVPIITIFTHNTNDWHDMYYKKIGFRSDTPFPVADLVAGPFHYLHSFYLFVCIMLSVIVLLMELRKSVFQFQMQILLMVFGLLTPIIASYFYLNKLSPYGIDLGPVSIGLTCLFHGLSIFMFRSFNVVPIARDTVFETMQEGVIVLNQKGIVVDFNNAVRQVIPMLHHRMVGEHILSIVKENKALVTIIQERKECDYRHEAGVIQHFHVRFSEVYNTSQVYVGQMITFSDVTERVNMQEDLRKLASIDGLTGVYNRTFFVRQAEEMFISLMKRGGVAGIIMFDIDYFKTVNDTYGHEMGDAVLRKISEVVQKNVRPADIIGRYGGEEFIVYLPATALYEAHSLAAQLREAIQNIAVEADGVKIRVTASFGVAALDIQLGNAACTLDEFVRKADQALYTAKRNGRNRVEV